VALTLYLVSAVGYGQVPVHKPIAPLSPNELLKFLPGTPQQWVLVSSTANNTFSDWLTSRATRTFRLAVAGSSAPNTPAQITKATISDTGYYRELLSQFANFRPGKGIGVEQLVVNSMPAIKVSRGATEILSVLI